MGGQLPTHVLAHQLTLSQPEGAYCAPQITICIAQTYLGSFLRPVDGQNFVVSAYIRVRSSIFSLFLQISKSQ